MSKRSELNSGIMFRSRFKTLGLFLSTLCLLLVATVQGWAETKDYIAISVDPAIHEDYGLSYPVTFSFTIPPSTPGLKAYKRYIETQDWTQIAEKTDSDFFNGIEAARFEYANNMVYISVAFDSDYDEIQLRITDQSNEVISITYQSICEYYDNRDAVVTSTADDWAYVWNLEFEEACNAFREAHVWLSVGIITGLVYNETWESIQSQLDMGYVEAASHSRTHPCKIPYEDTDSEVRGSKEDIINNLDLPDSFKKGTNEYIYTWIEPCGQCDDEARELLGENKYLVDRKTSDNYDQFAEWDIFDGLYERCGRSLKMGSDGIEDPATLNAKFDSVVAEGGIYHLMCHPQLVDWSPGSYVYEHLDYIKEKKNLWYVSLGHLYLYQFLQEGEGNILFVDQLPNSYVIIDNGDPGTSSTGNWRISGVPGPYGNNSLYSEEAGATYTFEASVDGFYEVSLWWTYHSYRCTSIAVEIYDGATLLDDSIEVNQQENNSQWNVLGTYAFTGTARVVIISAGGCDTCADAARLISAAPPELDYIEIEGPVYANENFSAQYDCRAHYTNGTDRLVESYTWDVDCSAYADISPTGLLTTYEVSSNEPCQVSVTYTEEDITRTATCDITIRDYVAPTEVIMDNGDPGTSSTGTWWISGGPGPYGDHSLYSEQAGATYTFEAPVDGFYEVSLWWTYHSYRCTRIAVEIYDGATLLDDSIRINEQENASQWNVLGTYEFTGTARVVIISAGGCDTCADAARLISAAPPELDYIEIEGPLYVNENSIAQYDCRAHYTSGTDRLVEADTWDVDCSAYADISPTGLLTTYEVSSDEACQISVTYTEGDISRTALCDITIKDYVAPTEVIIDDGNPGTSSTGTWRISGGPGPYGDHSLYSDQAGATYTFEASVDGFYEVSLWWTYHSYRCTSIAVEIYDGATLLDDNIRINEQENDSQWNVLGTYEFTGTARVVIISAGGCDTCADAARFVLYQ